MLRRPDLGRGLLEPFLGREVGAGGVPAVGRHGVAAVAAQAVTAYAIGGPHVAAIRGQACTEKRRNGLHFDW